MFFVCKVTFVDVHSSFQPCSGREAVRLLAWWHTSLSFCAFAGSSMEFQILTAPCHLQGYEWPTLELSVDICAPYIDDAFMQWAAE